MKNYFERGKLPGICICWRCANGILKPKIIEKSEKLIVDLSLPNSCYHPSKPLNKVYKQSL
jgi:hypothetical protein